MSGPLRRAVALAALLAAISGSRAYAQDAQAASAGQTAQSSRGGWFGAGLGYATFRTDCTNCERDDLYSAGGGLTVGGGLAINDQIDAGGELCWASTALDAGEYRAAFVLGVVQFRPWRGHGFYIKGGLGLAYIRASFAVDGEATESTPKGLGVHYGAGWMFGRGRRVSFAPFGAHYVASLGDLATTGGVAENPVSNVWFAGVNIFIR